MAENTDLGGKDEIEQSKRTMGYKNVMRRR